MTCGTSPEQEGYHQGIGNYHEFLKDVGRLKIRSKCLSTLMESVRNIQRTKRKEDSNSLNRSERHTDILNDIDDGFHP